jgi:Fe-S oxidoreductase
VATYKAEFLAHWYERRLRPPHAYALGLIDVWARLASRAPRLANGAARSRPLSRLLKATAGLAPERDLPVFATETFRERFSRRAGRPGGGAAVLLWPDTFTNHFHPQVGDAAADVLEAAGFDVRLPAGPLCCGRPLYDFGMLDRARRYLRRVLDALAPELRRGTRVVVLEPSCLAVFKDELVNLFPDDEDAHRLRDQSLLLSRLLLEHAQGWQAPRLDRPALVHGHCHQKALVGTEHDDALLAALGVEVTDPGAGCCGLAGSFGYERGEHYEVSMKAGEQVLLPAVRSTPAETLVVASGFSCRQQIAHATDRRALHLAEVVRLAYDGSR